MTRRDEAFFIASAIWLFAMTKPSARVAVVTSDDRWRQRDEIRRELRNLVPRYMSFFETERGWRHYELRTSIDFVPDRAESLAGICNDHVMIVFLGDVSRQVREVATGIVAGTKEHRISVA